MLIRERFYASAGVSCARRRNAEVEQIRAAGRQLEKLAHGTQKRRV